MGDAEGSDAIIIADPVEAVGKGVFTIGFIVGTGIRSILIDIDMFPDMLSGPSTACCCGDDDDDEDDHDVGCFTVGDPEGNEDGRSMFEGDAEDGRLVGSNTDDSDGSNGSGNDMDSIPRNGLYSSSMGATAIGFVVSDEKLMLNDKFLIGMDMLPNVR